MTHDELREAVAKAICYANGTNCFNNRCHTRGSCQSEIVCFQPEADAAIRVALGAAQAAMREQLIFTGECAKQPLFRLSELAGFWMCVREIAALMPKEPKP